MRDADRENFARLWRGAWALHAKPVSVEMLSVAFAALRDYELRDIEHALTLHVRDPERGQYPPKPADVIARMRPDPKADGRPGAEEAWAMMPRDEETTAVITVEMATAMGPALALLAEGDAVAARMAFREVYQREVEASRQAGRPVHWSVSPGRDAARRESVVREAVQRGRLSRAQAVQYLPHLDDTPLDPNGRKQLANIRALLSPTVKRIEQEAGSAAA